MGCTTKRPSLLPVGVKPTSAVSRAVVVVVPPTPKQVTLVWDSDFSVGPFYNFIDVSHDMTNWTRVNYKFPCNGVTNNTYTLSIISPTFFRMGVTNE